VVSRLRTPVREVLGKVVDPEIPVLTIADLGVLRDVRHVDGRVQVTITPTYSGCPAMEVIRADMEVGVRCPQCGSGDTRRQSRFGSTSCTSQWVQRVLRAVRPLPRDLSRVWSRGGGQVARQRRRQPGRQPGLAGRAAE
jgi:hypothetical protein